MLSTSLAIAQFIKDSKFDEEAAMTVLRNSLRESGGPLLEDVDDKALLTFVYIGAGERVSLCCQLFFSEFGTEAPMSRVAETSVWYISTILARRDIRVSYTFSVDAGQLQPTSEEWISVVRDPDSNLLLKLLKEDLRSSRSDPCNPYGFDVVTAPSGRVCLPVKRCSILTLPENQAPSWLGKSPQVGELKDHTFTSEAFGNDRNITIFVPPECGAEGGPYPLIVITDGEFHLGAGFPEILSSLIVDQIIPKCIAVFVHNPTLNSRMHEMNCNRAMVDCYADELIPWVRDRYCISRRPEDVVIVGASYGALASAWVATQRSDIFGNVLSMSGSYWWAREPSGDQISRMPEPCAGEPEWLTRNISVHATCSIRWFISVGILENQPFGAGVDLLSSNRHLRTVLRAKSYDFRYEEYPGGHDHAAWQINFGTGLKYLLAGGKAQNQEIWTSDWASARY